MCMNFIVLNFGRLNFHLDTLIWKVGTPWYEKLLSNAEVAYRFAHIPSWPVCLHKTIVCNSSYTNKGIITKLSQMVDLNV